MYGMVHQEHVKIIIPIVIKEHGLGIESFSIQSVLLCFLCKSQIAIVDKKLIASGEDLVIPHFRYIYIYIPVSIHIGYRNSCLPVPFTPNSSLAGYILELQISFV